MEFERSIPKQIAKVFEESFGCNDFVGKGEVVATSFLARVNEQYDFLKTKSEDELLALKAKLAAYENLGSDAKAKDALDGELVTKLSLFPSMALNDIKDHYEFLCDLNDFLKSWYNESPYLEVSTSGSTGVPKKLLVEKERMMHSAVTTVSFLGLKAGDKAQLCMPLKYIAGKMIVVRSLVSGMKLIVTAPSSSPLKDMTLTYLPNFSAMVPLQVIGSLEKESERKCLGEMEHLIIGGGAVNDEVAEVLKDFNNKVWSTYGMTETLSHIALKRLSGEEASLWYSKFDGVDLSLSEEGTLTINAPHVCSETLHTNDIVEFNSLGQFRILGRKDNTINTGGVKVQIEEVERLLTEALRNRPAVMPSLMPSELDETKNNLIVGSFDFAVTSVPDVRLGEKIVLLVAPKGEDGCNLDAVELFFEGAFTTLPKFHAPKQILRVDTIPHTETGKIDRANCKKLAASTAK